MNVVVASARIGVLARATPVSASSPLGMSSASTGAAPWLARAIHCACGASMSRARPMPNRPSTTSPGASPPVHSARVIPPHSFHARHAAAASPAKRCASPANATSTSKYQDLSSRATTKASPPLLPGSRQDLHASRARGDPVACDLRRSQPGTFHQRLPRRTTLEQPHLGDAQDRIVCHAAIIGAPRDRLSLVPPRRYGVGHSPGQWLHWRDKTGTHDLEQQ